MTSSIAPTPGTRALPALEPAALRCGTCGACFAPAPLAICSSCLAPLEPVYPHRPLPDRDRIAARPHSLWRYREWLPFTGPPRYAADAGWTRLVDAPALARLLGVAECHLKVDAWSTPSLSFKDRVVTTAINAAHAFGHQAIACASTGNLANAVAAAAAVAGLPAWVFIPEDLEPAKMIATSVYGATVIRVRGTYDDVNRLCAQLAERFPWGFVNVNLRAYYGEGSKTMAFEIAEQLGWRSPDAVVAPMAGGSLVTKLDKGFREFAESGLIAGGSPRIFGVQAEGCAPIVELFERGDDVLRPVVPRTIARSLAIGNPADGRQAARVLRSSGGSAVGVTDAELVAAIGTLASTSGVFGETAAGVTVAGALRLAREKRFSPSDCLVLCLTGNGLKTVHAAPATIERIPVVEPKVRSVATLIERITGEAEHQPLTTNH